MESPGPEERELHPRDGAPAASRASVHPGGSSSPLDELLPDGSVATDPQGEIRWANRAAAALLNTTPRSLVGRSMLRFLLPEAIAVFRAEVVARLEATQVHAWEAVLQPRDSAPIEVAVTLIVEQDAAGRQSGLRWLLRDITEWKRSEAGLRFLVQAGQALAARVEYEVTLTTVARLALPTFADCCGVYLAGQNDPLRPLILAHPDAESEARLRELIECRPPDPLAPIGVPKVFRTGKPECVSEISDAFLKRHAEDAAHLGLLLDLGFGSYMVVPLRARGRTWGAFTFCRKASRPPYGAEDLTVAEQVAFMAVLTMDNSRLYQQARAAGRAGEAGLSQPDVRSSSRRKFL